MAEEPNHDKEEIERKKKDVGRSLCCPYCSERLLKWEVPQTMFTQWPNEYFYICFNDECSYYTNSSSVMATLGNKFSYRLMYDPLTNSCNPIPVYNKNTLRDGIID